MRERFVRGSNICYRTNFFSENLSPSSLFLKVGWFTYYKDFPHAVPFEERLKTYADCVCGVVNFSEAPIVYFKLVSMFPVNISLSEY